ncbi:hypothetical protein D3C83_101970 [compost metagenome]
MNRRALVRKGPQPERRYEGLPFDFVTKRSLRYRGSRFADAAFETRDSFLRTHG